MSTVLVAWELGAGLGHVTVIRPLVERLLDQGHRVVVAIKELHRIHQLCDAQAVTCLQAPVLSGALRHPVRHPSTFAHLLHNCGFGDPQALAVTGEAWRGLFEYVRPDVAVFDHSPTALLASRCFDLRRVVIGNGFCCPADGSPMPDWRPWMKRDPRQLARDERAVLRAANRQLAVWKAPRLARLSDLYTQADVTALATLPELDHFGRRNKRDYFGIWSHRSGKAPEWPTAGTGDRAYVYVRSFAGMHALFRILTHWRVPTLVYADGIDRAVQDRFSCETLRFESEMLDLDAVGRQCDVAILNATHGTTGAMLLSGKPTLLIPYHLEQHLTARNVVALGAGLAAHPRKPRQIGDRLRSLLTQPRFAEAARRFSRRYQAMEPARQLVRLMERLEGLLA